MAAQGDPQIVGIPVFVVGSIALGFTLTRYVPAAALGAALPIIFTATGIFLLISTIWAGALGQTYVAGVFGIFSGFWLSYTALLLSLDHNWLLIPAANVPRTIALFAISWLAVIFFGLTLPAFRLPLVYPLVMLAVDVALGLVATAALQNSDSLFKAAGICAYVFAGLGMWIFVSVSNMSLGGKPLPLGPVLVKPAPAPAT